MSDLIRPLGYTGKLQQLVWTGSPAQVTAYAGGGGGGGGGNDSNSGGRGSGGGFAQGSFIISPGDIIQVAVGGAGRAGASGQGSANGGLGGASYLGAQSYYGGVGGDSGPSGSSGAGGGGGGATVILLNGVPIITAGGGGGGGGGGNTGTAVGESSPGTAGSSNSTTGKNGTDKTNDGGGGGAGGGGELGGNGGGVRSGDQGGLAGFYGTGLGEAAQNPTGQQPANQNSSYYVGNPGVGGNATSSGTSGFASLVFVVNGTYIKESGSFKPANVFLKQNNVWQSVDSTWVKQDGIWKSIAGSFVPNFTNIEGNFGGPATTCISVIDECSVSSSTISSGWNTFLVRRTGVPLYLLQPGGPSRGSLKVPSNFNSSGQGFGPTTVNRDNGSVGARSDWFAIANLSSAPAGSIVEVSVDNSGSMTFDTVSASYAYLVEQCNAAGITVVNRTMSGENWIAPFI